VPGLRVWVVLKKTPVNTSVGTNTSDRDVFFSVTVSVLLDNSNSADAARVPLDPVNMRASLVPVHAKSPHAKMTKSTLKNTFRIPGIPVFIKPPFHNKVIYLWRLIHGQTIRNKKRQRTMVII
jgi:IS4 transposase